MSDNEEILSRRNFFRLGAHKAAKAAMDVAEVRIGQRASRYIRPPFASNEIDFLVKCTRCHDCIGACPHDTIFPLSAKLGIEIVSTPALDLTHGACHLCADWPCVAACEPGALNLPEPEEPEEDGGELPPILPRLSEARIDTAMCLPYSGPECGACGSVCPVPGAILWDMTRPQIDMEKCTGCGLCRKICATEPKSVIIAAIKASEE